MANRSRKPPVPSLEEAVFLDLVRTADLLSRGPTQVLKTHDLSPAQYNVLRILRGSPRGLTCGEIGNRMITRDSDITRLLDRMEKRGLIARSRQVRDRRVVLTKATPAALALLARLDRKVQAAHRKQLGHLGRARLEALADLLAACRKRAL